jgi:hypothetical protein
MSGAGAPSRQDALLFSPQRQALWAGLESGTGAGHCAVAYLQPAFKAYDSVIP